MSARQLCSLVVVFILLGCGRANEQSAPRMANEGFNLAESERETLIQQAAGGAAQAAFRLSEYYGLYLGNSAEHERWLRRATELGHALAAYNLGATFERRKSVSEARHFFSLALERARAEGNAGLASAAEESLAHLPRAWSPVP